MKILHVIPTYIPSYRSSGPINVVHAMNKWLVRAGAEVTVYTTNADAPDEETNVSLNTPVNIDGVKVFYFRTSFPRRWYYSRTLSKKLSATVKDFDIVHITSVFLAASTVTAYYSKKFKKPYVISAYGSFMERPLRQRTLLKKFYIWLVERRNLASASAIHFVSEKEREEYLKTGLPLRMGVVVFSGVDPEVFRNDLRVKDFRSRMGIPGGDKIVLFMGRLYWIKGLDTLIPAFAQLVKERPNTTLLLAGYEDKGYGSEVRRLIEGYRLGGKAIVPGPIFGDDKNAALSESDVFVLPSYSEAASIATIEAMFFGLPIVITKNCGFSFEVEKAGAGLVVDKDANEVERAILSILNDESFARKLGKKGKKFAEENLVFDKIAGEFLKMYSAIVKNHNLAN